MEIYDFGLRLKGLRLKKGFTQNAVAEKLKLKKSTISGYERNVTTPSLDILSQMAIIYNSSTDYMLGLTDRKCYYLDDLTASQQETVLKIVSELTKELKKYDTID